MAQKLTKEQLETAIEILNNSNNYVLLSDTGMVLFNLDIKPEKMAALEHLMKQCVDAYMRQTSGRN